MKEGMAASPFFMSIHNRFSTRISKPALTSIKEFIQKADRYLQIGPAKVSVTLANIEEGLWKYVTTSSQYETWLTNAEESGILPVFREPAEVYNNIKGGFGIFASYNCTDSLIVKIDTEPTIQ